LYFFVIIHLEGFRNFVLIKVHGLQPPSAPERVQLLDLQGHLIGEVPFRPRITNKFAFDWLNFEPPTGLFYVRLVGVDDEYNVFYRMSQTALSALLPGLLENGSQRHINISAD